MKKELIDILACPVCHGDLDITLEIQDKTEIIAGTLTCKKCKRTYPITDSIPNLLPPEKE